MAMEGSYWGASASVAGVLQDLHVRGPSDVEVSLKVQGTNEENLLKWASGNPGEVLRVHLCGGACPERLDADNLLHGANINRRVEEDLPWMTNLVVESAPARQPAGAGLLSGEAGGGEGADRGGEKAKSAEKKKDKEKRKRRRSRERGQSRGRTREKIGLRGGAKKKLEDVLGGTGLSPDPRFRRRFANRGAWDHPGTLGSLSPRLAEAGCLKLRFAYVCLF